MKTNSRTSSASNRLTIEPLRASADPLSRTGRWTVDAKNAVSYRSAGRGESASVRALIAGFDERTLVLSLEQAQKNQTVSGREAKLSGSWRADERNRLVFDVRRARGPADSLTLSGSWEGSATGLSYRYATENLKTKRRVEKRISFDGSWAAGKNGALVYTLAKSGRAIELKGAFQTRSVTAKRGEIRYRVGAGLKNAAEGEVSLFGDWKLGRDLTLRFEAAGRRKSSLEFGAVYSFAGKNRISAALKTSGGRPAGFEVLFSRRLGAGDAFARLDRSARESLVEGGMAFRW